ncbi:hypothetical protein A2U01_0102533, partial [Trifolium medium]|nr:hypothetical protein [Trifolium medium]
MMHAHLGKSVLNPSVVVNSDVGAVKETVPETSVVQSV